MGKRFLQLTSRKTTTLDLGEGGELVVRTDISKGAFRALLSRMPADLKEGENLSALQASDFATGLFEALVVGWNATDENGNDVPAEVDNYLELPNEVASTIDGKLFEYFNSLNVSEADKSSSETTGGGVSEVQPEQLPVDVES